MTLTSETRMGRRVIGTLTVLCVMLSGTLCVAATKAARVPMYVQASRQLDEANSRLRNALALADLSLIRHKAQENWTREHMRRAKEVLEGEKPSVVQLLEETRHQVAGQSAFPMAGRAIDSAIDYLRLATFHLNHALAADTAAGVSAHARQTAGLISAAIGRSGMQTPAIGSLSYAREIVALWTLPVAPQRNLNGLTNEYDVVAGP